MGMWGYFVNYLKQYLATGKICVRFHLFMYIPEKVVADILHFVVFPDEPEEEYPQK